MVTRLLIGTLNGFGILAFLGGILINIGDIKAFLLFAIGFLYAIARLVIYVVKSVQDIRWRERKLRGK